MVPVAGRREKREVGPLLRTAGRGRLRGMNAPEIPPRAVAEALASAEIIEAVARILTERLHRPVGLHEALLGVVGVLRPEALPGLDGGGQGD